MSLEALRRFEPLALGLGALIAVAMAARLLRPGRRGKDRDGMDEPPVAPRASGGFALARGAGRRRRNDPESIVEEARASDLRSSVEEERAEEEFAADVVLLAEHLMDIRDACGAEEAVFWRLMPGGADHPETARLVPAVWSTADAPRPAYFDTARWGPMVSWANEGGVVVFDTDTDVEAARCCAAPVILDRRPIGVLSVTAAGGLGMPAASAKQWMPRYAAQLIRLLTLSEQRRESSRSMRQMAALFKTLRQLQQHSSQEVLGRFVCDTAMEVTSATAAALVRWRADMEKGSVRHTTDRFRHRAPFPLDGNTLVSEACRTGEQQLHQNAAHYGPSISVFEAGDGAWRQGPIGIVPLKRDKGVIGALVVAADAEEAITADELETLEVLGTVAAAQLEIVWEIDEVSKRARQDALTGLANRRSFDEHLRRLLNEAERFGQPLSLVLADIDHFKRINDTWGHEAGDEVLRRVARALQEGVRQVDVAARYGGEEIALLLPQTSMAGAADLADRLRRAVAGRPVKFKGEEIAVTLSFGVAAFPTSVRTRDGLFRAADQALYEAKAGGRNCVKVASGSNAQEAT